MGRKSKLTATVDCLAEQLISGRKLPKVPPGLGPVTEEDREALTRVAGASLAAFDEAMGRKLGEIADLAVQRIREKLEKDEFKSSELGFALSVALDKRSAITGRSQVGQAAVNTQVNVYLGGGRSKEDLIRVIRGEDKQDDAVI